MLLLRCLAVLGLLVLLPVGNTRAEIGPGRGQQTITLPTVSLTIFTYRPACAQPSLLVVLHGLNRNADRYRDYAEAIADRDCMLVVAPLFDRDRFPTWRYQHGGIMRGGVAQPSDKWTGRIVLELVEHVRKLEGRPLGYSLIGHSAGGQFLSRVAAFVPTQAQRIVVANPGTYAFATLQAKAPYGLGGVYADGAATAELRRYLAQPVTVFLGQDDTGSDDLNESAAAMAQGSTRYERGLNAFKTAQELARANAWTFNWRLIELPGAGHSARKMSASRQASEALRP